MERANNQRFLGLFFIFCVLFLSNASVFITILWLSPQFVFIEAVLWLIFAALAVWILHKHKLLSKFLQLLKQNWIIYPFLAYSGMSIFWSVYWQVSLARWLILFSTIIVGGYIGMVYQIKGIMKILTVFGIYILLLSTLLVLLAPSFGVMNYYSIQGAWKGLYWHKNHMGVIAAFINLLFLFNLIRSLQTQVRHALFWGILYLSSLFFIYQTDSVAAYITTIIVHGITMLVLILIKYKHNIHRSHYLIAIAIIILAVIIVAINLDDFLAVFNRNTSLTGRIPMWGYLFNHYFSRRSLFGYGFNAFWYIEPHRLMLQHAAGYPDPIIISDNGFIDILMNTGIMGLILFLIFYLGAWWRSIKGATKAHEISEAFPLVLMSFTLIANISWSLIFENESYLMLIMLSVLFGAPGSDSAIKED